MKNNPIKLNRSLTWLITPAIFIVGLWLIVIRPLGPNFSRLPGNLGDTRFSNYILEHDFRWITGKDSSLWNAPFFYPYRQSLAMSDNFLGSMLFYSGFRWMGLDRESAMQYWYVLSYFLSFWAAAYVLIKLNLKPLSVGLGAFFFTYGLPILAQEGHVQLAYRFCIPLASYYLWLFSQGKQFKHLVWSFLWLVWQFYLSIYLGYFLLLFIFFLILGLPFIQNKNLNEVARYWPGLIKEAWKKSNWKMVILDLGAIALLYLAMGFLFRPYVITSKIYGFLYSWGYITRLLPRIQSYFLADGSMIWHSLSSLLLQGVEYRWEHQLFVGGSVFLMICIGLVWHFKSDNRRMAGLFLGASGFLILLTLYINGFSFYKTLYLLPGINSIRAITRMIIVLMWPIAVFISVVSDALLRAGNRYYIHLTLVFLIMIGGISESVFYNHDTFLITETDNRIQTLRMQLPNNTLENPVLYVWNPSNNFWYLNELDAMLLSQDLGWPVMNGYSGNLPPGYGPTKNCDQAVTRIKKYMDFSKTTDPSVYKNLISRIVSIGPEECHWNLEGSRFFTFPQGRLLGTNSDLTLKKYAY